MVGWGPGPVNVAYRKPLAMERERLQLPRKRQCIVAIAVGDGSWTCVLAGSGAYWCPPLKEPTGPGIERNARLDKQGFLALDRPPKGTHATSPLPWDRYPVVDGYIQPWTANGSLRPGLRFKDQGRGPCFLADDTAYPAVSCLRPDSGRDGACFPQHRDGRSGQIAACSSGPGSTTFTRWKVSGRIRDPQALLVPWRGVGGIFLGEPRARVIRVYGTQPELGYRMPGGIVQVGYDGGKVSSIWLSSPYYRTNDGFGVGSKVPPARRRGFLWNASKRDKPCSCWVKVGTGARSLPATTDNFLKPWTFINVKHGRVASFYFASRFVD